MAPANERTHTDHRLQTERDRTDEELLARTASLQEDSDDVVARARDRARAVLLAARDRADELLRSAPPAERARVAAERQADDAATTADQSIADARLVAERAERQEILDGLLATERTATDNSLRAERRRTDERIASRDDTLAVISHDLRGLAAVAATNAGVISLLTRHESDGIIHQSAKNIEITLRRVAHLLQDLIDLDSLEAGTLTLELQPMDLAAFLSELRDQYLPIAQREHHELIVEMPAEPLSVRADRERLLQVLGNVVGNAFKFTPAGGQVLVRATRRAEGVAISVADTGRGIPADKIERAFERSWRGQHDRRGAGLGLYIARKIMDAHGGRIWAERRPEGGTLVTVLLPTS